MHSVCCRCHTGCRRVVATGLPLLCEDVARAGSTASYSAVPAGTNADWCLGMAALQAELPDILLDREVNGRRELDLWYSHLDWWVRFR